MHRGETASCIAVWVLINHLGKETCQLCLWESNKLEQIDTQFI